jgi:hypothetical protein
MSLQGAGPLESVSRALREWRPVGGLRPGEALPLLRSGQIRSDTLPTMCEYQQIERRARGVQAL